MSLLDQRRSFLRAGLATSAMAGFPLASWAQGGRSFNANIFCFSMGSPQEIARFKAASGIDMNVACWTNSIDTFTKLATGGGRTTDLINSSRQYIGAGIQRNLFAPLDLSKVPNAKHLSPFFANPAYSTVGGKQYSLPFMFGFDSVVYNKKIGPVDSYGVLFDDKYKGRVSIRDDPNTMIPQTALFLGMKNPLRLSSAELKEVTKFLISKKGNFRKLWTGFADAVALLKSEEVVAVGDGWVSMAWTLNEGGKKDQFAIANPKEKALVWTQDWLMPAEAAGRPTADLVYEYMNWSLGADQAAYIGRNAGYVSASQLGRPQLTKEEAKAIGYDDFETIFKNGSPLNEVPPNIQEYTEAWNRFKSA